MKTSNAEVEENEDSDPTVSVIEGMLAVADRWEEWLTEVHDRVGFAGERRLIFRCVSCNVLVMEKSEEIKEHSGHERLIIATAGEEYDLIRLKWKLFKQTFDGLAMEDRGLIEHRMENLRQKATLMATQAMERKPEDVLA